MLSPRTLLRRVRGTVAFDERTGDVCTPACQAAARREHDATRSLFLRGPR